jgi:hypothetical protein
MRWFFGVAEAKAEASDVDPGHCSHWNIFNYISMLAKKSSKFCLMKITTLDEDRSNQDSYVNIQIHSKHTLYS